MAKVAKKGDLFKAVRAGDRDECSRVLESEGVDMKKKMKTHGLAHLR